VTVDRAPARNRHSPKAVERLASRIGGVLLFALATYVVLAAGWNLRDRRGQEFSLAGLILTILAIPVVDKLGSPALRTDAVESITWGWLSLVAVVSLAAQAVLGFWWIDSVGSLAIL
jgi:divalent metal cation (Fe/Co/Zn/Cd) transporter